MENNNEQEFIDCINTFLRHEYEKCSNDALNLIMKRMFHWLMQIMLISLQRNNRYDLLEQFGPVAIQSFSDHPFVVNLIKLTLGQISIEELRPLAANEKEQCQLLFYEGSLLLTKGDRKNALDCFEKCIEQCSTFNIDCPECFMASKEISLSESKFAKLDEMIMKAAWLKHENKLQESDQAGKDAYKYFAENFDDKKNSLHYFERICHIIGEQTGDDKTSFVDLRKLEYAELEPIENETEFFQKKYKPPFSRFKGNCKRISSALSPLQSIALLFAFPGFTGKSISDTTLADTEAFDKAVRKQSTYDKTLEHQLSKRKFFRRRYSGDTHAPLPRERYFSLCNKENDKSLYTLVFEMNAYSMSFLTGYCVALPGKNGDSITIKFIGLPEESNPLYKFINTPEEFAVFKRTPANPVQFITQEIVSLVPDDNEYCISIPCSTVSIELENALDLRSSLARTWMLDFFINPPPCKTDKDFAHGAFLKSFARQYKIDLNNITNWKSFIHITSTKTIGGNGMLDLFALFVRSLGCDGLIFPSARCDYGVVCVDGNIEDYWGWNLVDYRDTPIPMRIAPEFPRPLEKLEGVNNIADITEGRYAGSLLHLGGSFHTRFACEQHYHEFLVLNGPEWRMKRPVKILSAGGYCWFTRDYTVAKPAKDISCKYCETSFPSEFGLYPQCPACGLYGDISGVFVKIPPFFYEKLEEAEA